MHSCLKLIVRGTPPRTEYLPEFFLTPKKIRSIHRWPARLYSVRPPVPRPPRLYTCLGTAAGTDCVTPRRRDKAWIGSSSPSGERGALLTPLRAEKGHRKRPCHALPPTFSLSGTPNAFRAGKLDKHFFATGRRKRCTGLDSCNKGLP